MLVLLCSIPIEIKKESVMLHILGMGYSHPTSFIDNSFLESLDIGTNAQWIIDKIGVKTRVTSLNTDYIARTRNQDLQSAQDIATHSPIDLGMTAALMASEKAGIPLEKIGLVISNSCNVRFSAPSQAQIIAHQLGMNCQAYDCTSACPAFALHMNYLNSFKEGSLPEYILCISASAVTQSVNYNDRSDGAIWGDGAAAWIVATKEIGKLKVLHTLFEADPTRCGAVVVDRYGHFRQDGRAVRDFSVRQTVRLIKRVEKEFEIDWKRDIFIGHQANRTMLEQICRNRKIPAENHWHNVAEFGNQAGAGAPIVLGQHWEKLECGQKVVAAVVGAGLSWGTVVFEVL